MSIIAVFPSPGRASKHRFPGTANDHMCGKTFGFRIHLQLYTIKTQSNITLIVLTVRFLSTACEWSILISTHTQIVPVHGKGSANMLEIILNFHFLVFNVKLTVCISVVPDSLKTTCFFLNVTVKVLCEIF